MTDSLADILAKLRFESRPIEALYLNETRVREHFVGYLGAIDSFTRTAAKAGNLETPIIKVGAGITSEATVTWDTHNPIAQVLILRSALEAQNKLHSPHTARPDRWVSFSGIGFASRPHLFDDIHRDGLREFPYLYESLEAERAEQENIERLIDIGPKQTLWLVSLTDRASVCAAFLDKKWLRPAFSRFVNPNYAVMRWEIFGKCRQIHESGVPLLSTLYVGVKWGGE